MAEESESKDDVTLASSSTVTMKDDLLFEQKHLPTSAIDAISASSENANAEKASVGNLVKVVPRAVVPVAQHSIYDPPPYFVSLPGFAPAPLLFSNNGTTTASMLLNKVLQGREIQYADQIFGLSDYDIIMELVTNKTLVQLKTIFNDPHYTKNVNDQSVVELILSRTTAAIRETGCIETYAPSLVDLLEGCLFHKMFVDTGNHNSPHCKIVLELLSILFLYHSKKSVMTVTIPVAIKALNSLNQELVRNVTSYLSLAAIHNGSTIAKFAVQIITKILNGNYQLIRVLPQIYPENREPFHAHLSQLLRLLHDPATEIPEKLSLLQFVSMITNNKPDLIIPYLPEFHEFLVNNTTCTAILHIFLSLISMGRVLSLVGQLRALRRAARHPSTHPNNLATIGKIVGVIGRSCGSEEVAVVALQDLIELCRHPSNYQNLPILLREIEGIAETHQNSARNFLSAIRTLSEHNTSTHSAYMRILSAVIGNEPVQPQTSLLESREQRIQHLNSLNSLHSSAHILPTDPSPNTTYTPLVKQATAVPTSRDIIISELDRNMQTFFDFYKMRSNGSLGYAFARNAPVNGSARASRHSFLNLDHPFLPSAPAKNTSTISTTSMLNPIQHTSKEALAARMSNHEKPGRTGLDEQPTTLKSTPRELFSSVRNEKTPNNFELYRSTHQASNQQHCTAAPIKPPTKEFYLTRHNDTKHEFAQKVPKIQERFHPISHESKMALRTYQHQLPSFDESTVFPSTVDAIFFPVKNQQANIFQAFPSQQNSAAVKTTPPKSTTSNELVSADQGTISSPRSLCTPFAASHNSLHNPTGLLRQSIRSVRNDVVYQFVEHRRSKIKRFVNDVMAKCPIPSNCELESMKRGRKQHLLMQLFCQVNDEHCAFNNTRGSAFTFRTKFAQVWMHLVFLQKQVNSIETTGKVLTQESIEFKHLAYIWQTLSSKETKSRRFVNVATSAFPSSKAQEMILRELKLNRYFDCFMYNIQLNKWSCFRSFLSVDNASVALLEGQLKAKDGHLSATLTSFPVKQRVSISDSEGADKIISPSGIDLHKIKSVRSLTRGRKSPKFLKAFEIFTDDNRILLKASDRNKAEEWFKSLQIAVAQSQREKPTQIA